MSSHACPCGTLVAATLPGVFWWPHHRCQGLTAAGNDCCWILTAGKARCLDHMGPRPHTIQHTSPTTTPRPPALGAKVEYSARLGHPGTMHVVPNIPKDDTGATEGRDVVTSDTEPGHRPELHLGGASPTPGPGAADPAGVGPVSSPVCDELRQRFPSDSVGLARGTETWCCACITTEDVAAAIITATTSTVCCGAWASARTRACHTCGTILHPEDPTIPVTPTAPAAAHPCSRCGITVSANAPEDPKVVHERLVSRVEAIMMFVYAGGDLTTVGWDDFPALDIDDLI